MREDFFFKFSWFVSHWGEDEIISWLQVLRLRSSKIIGYWYNPLQVNCTTRIHMKICVPRTLGWIDNRGRQENKGECSLGQLARQQPKALPEVPPCPVVTACSLQFSEAVQSGLVTSSPGWRDRNSLGRVTAAIWVHFDLKKKRHQKRYITKGTV